MVAYELIAPDQDYEPVFAALTSHQHCGYLKSGYLIDTREDRSALRGQLAGLIGENDTLCIFKLAGQWAINRPLPCAAWLSDPGRTW